MTFLPRAWLATLVVVPLALQAQAAQLARSATVSTQGLQVKPIARGPKAGKLRAEQHFTFALGDTTFRTRYSVVMDPKQKGKAFPSEGYIGMPGPSSCNWYAGGFLFVRINGRDIGRTKLHAGVVSETGSRAMADLVWDAEVARVRVRLAGLAGDDKLLCEIALEPKQEIKSLRVLLRCYPSFFTAWHKRNGDRKIATPAATLKQGDNVTLPADKHWYGVYYDTIFDVAKGEGHGPCAAMFPPDTFKTVRFGVGSYGVETELTCRPDARRVRLAFWDFRKQANAAVLDRFRRRAKAWATQLAEFDFTAESVRGFDRKAALAELATLTRSAAVRKQLGAKADTYRKRIEALVPTTGQPGILQETELVGLITEYRDFLWELKVAALLAD